MKNKICIIGGCGHIGLSLGLLFAEKYSVTLFDTNKKHVKLINDGKLPFEEPGTQDLLDKNKDNIKATNKPDSIRNTEIILITTYADIINVLDMYKKYLTNQFIIICSTLAIGDSEKINLWIKDNNLNIQFAYCPERASQGNMLDELRKIPQIISGDNTAIECAAGIFSAINQNNVRFSYKEAEFAKLYSNTYRYLTFAIANQMFMSADEQGLELYHIHDQLMKDNPRSFEIPTALFTAGPCLPKDALLLSNASSYKKLINAAFELNNSFPEFTLKHIQENGFKTIGILGMAFKGNCSDLRNSLAVKLRDLLIGHGYTVYCHDPYHNFDTLEHVLQNSDFVVMGCTHNEYKGIKFRGECLWEN